MAGYDAASKSPAIMPTRRVGRYDLLAELGRGGMASVYLARSFGSSGFERLAAVKLLHAVLCADPDFVEMFLDEARVASRLHHPNASAIIDVGAEGSQLYMVMEYVEGDTLHAVQRVAAGLERAVPLPIVLRVVLDALAGLEAAHQLTGADGAPLGLIHRDVTPQNVLVGVDGVARLVDFGIARAACRAGVTAVGVLKGKLAFMAPEQIRGRAVDRRADIFSMGVTLWETIALRRCFPSREGAAMVRVTPEGYRPLADLAPNVPRALDAICQRALAFSPADRFATAAEFAEAIESSFLTEIATQRELAQFMSVVAADKLRGEREAARASSPSMAPRPVRATASPPSMRPASPRPSLPALDLRAPRLPTFDLPPGRSLRPAIDDALVGPDDVTSIAHSKRPAASAESRRVSLPALPRPSTSPTARTSLAPRPEAAASTPFEDATRAFPLHRPRTSLLPPLPREPERFRDPSDDRDDGRVSEVRRALHLPAVQAPAMPTPAVPAPAVPAAAVLAPVEATPRLELPELRPPAPPASPPLVGLRGLITRLWARLLGA